MSPMILGAIALMFMALMLIISASPHRARRRGGSAPGRIRWRSMTLEEIELAQQPTRHHPAIRQARNSSSASRQNARWKLHATSWS